MLNESADKILTLAKASNAKILGFNVRPNKEAKELASSYKTEIGYFNIIYEAIEFVEKSIRNQMMAYGQLEPTKKDIDSITARIFSNEEEVKRMTHQLISEKLLVLYKEKVNKKITETSYEKYIELAYKKND